MELSGKIERAAAVFCCAAAVLTAVVTPVRAQQTPDYEQPPISYSKSAPHDPVTPLLKAAEAGTSDLAPDVQRGYLESLLRELKISPSSQTLVFSRTSFQRDRISPHRPRAVYFNDDTYVGYVPGGDVLEIASTDPTLGSTFYTLQQSVRPPRLIRQTENCLQCHGESMTRDIPGLLVRSLFVDSGGEPILSAGTFLTTHESPLAERWGGWYVTGDTGGQRHMGNALFEEREGADPKPLGPPPAIDPGAYLTPHSDIVALLVLEHQVEAHNRITRAAQGTLRALRDEKVMADALGETLQSSAHSDSTNSRVKSSCEPLVEYLLFSGEAPLRGPVQGDSKFAAEFSARGPRDSQGRSLRDFELKSRLFRYPCSYLIYSSAVDGLPDAARDYVYRRLFEVLVGNEDSKAYSHLAPTDRKAVAQILRETRPPLRAAWESLEKTREKTRRP